jgi:hypothetical protein
LNGKGASKFILAQISGFLKGLNGKVLGFFLQMKKTIAPRIPSLKRRALLLALGKAQVLFPH